ncbi:MAG: hypothetical protein A3G35_04875 [candidate division NC10 bacterium RIFCSPLOWO2_12_FULL_66_18]|nr:MAG: hypothetical protein A3G35_04875 [candidate division NC10 bacterium RIFCSPLOWO2_12_FULL_66_18]
MASTKTKKWALIILAAIVLLVVGAIVGFQAAVGLLKGKVVEALGPDSEVKELRVRWSAVELDGLRIKARQGWPTADTLRADRVVIVPSLRSLLSGRIQVSSITVVRPYLSALRTRDGKLQVVPSLLAGAASEGKAAAGPPAQSVTISRITLEDGVVELFDATVAQPPLKIRLEKIQAAMRDVVAPALTGKSRFDLAALVKGLQRDGRATVSGWVEVASKDSAVKLQLRSVDLVLLQPYLTQATETRVQRGALDLDLDSEVKQNRLRAPGKVVISDLEFTPTRGVLDTFMGVPRAAVVNFLKNRENKIAINFILEGDINNPRFALNEAFATRLATGLAENLGVSIRGVAEGVGTLGQKGLEAAGEAARGVGSALQQLLGGQKKR